MWRDIVDILWSIYYEMLITMPAIFSNYIKTLGWLSLNSDTNTFRGKMKVDFNKNLYLFVSFSVLTYSVVHWLCVFWYKLLLFKSLYIVWPLPCLCADYTAQWSRTLTVPALWCQQIQQASRITILDINASCWILCFPCKSSATLV